MSCKICISTINKPENVTCAFSTFKFICEDDLALKPSHTLLKNPTIIEIVPENSSNDSAEFYCHEMQYLMHMLSNYCFFRLTSKILIFKWKNQSIANLNPKYLKYTPRHCSILFVFPKVHETVPSKINNIPLSEYKLIYRTI